jgi:signal transduction histidine kinase
MPDADLTEAKLELQDPSDGARFLLANLKPTRSQEKAGLIVATISIIAFLVTVPFATVSLPKIEVFIPATQGIVCVNDMFTAFLLFSQFSITRRPAILLVACGYLFVALIVIPHALTFPGAFVPFGLLGASINSTPWIYFFWHTGFPLAVLGYALLNRSGDKIVGSSSLLAIGLSAMAVLATVIGLTWLATEGVRLLPPFVVAPNERTPLVYFLGVMDATIGTLALIFLWRQRRSVLDLWLMVVMLALVLEVTLVALFTAERFLLGFYAGRAYTLATSITVLIALIAETTQLDARLARSNAMLRRERDSRLISAAAVVASISHEVRQPLAAIAMNGGAATRFLAMTPPDHDEVRSALDAVLEDSRRAQQVVESMGGLFIGERQSWQRLDINKVVREALRALEPNLRRHGVVLTEELAPQLPMVAGDSSQLQEVVINLINNAVEAMSLTSGNSRRLHVRTDYLAPDQISVAIADSGPGISPEKMAKLFDPFVTSKSDGMGLGLAICRVIIERHGGNISASSPGEARGALFCFVLPSVRPERPVNIVRAAPIEPHREIA